MLYYRPTFQSYRSTRMMATHTEKGNYGNDTGHPDVKYEHKLSKFKTFNK